MSDAGKFVILHVEDDDAHAELVTREFEAEDSPFRMERATDGEDALDYLFGRGAYADRSLHPLPQLILLDLRLPRVDGIEVLTAIKADPALKVIPVVMLSSSDSERDVFRAYEAHVNSYVVKPFEYAKFRSLLAELGSYWMSVNVRPR